MSVPRSQATAVDELARALSAGRPPNDVGGLAVEAAREVAARLLPGRPELREVAEEAAIEAFAKWFARVEAGEFAPGPNGNLGGYLHSTLTRAAWRAVGSPTWQSVRDRVMFVSKRSLLVYTSASSAEKLIGLPEWGARRPEFSPTERYLALRSGEGRRAFLRYHLRGTNPMPRDLPRGLSAHPGPLSVAELVAHLVAWSGTPLTPSHVTTILFALLDLPNCSEELSIDDPERPLLELGEIVGLPSSDWPPSPGDGANGEGRHGPRQVCDEHGSVDPYRLAAWIADALTAYLAGRYRVRCASATAWILGLSGLLKVTLVEAMGSPAELARRLGLSAEGRLPQLALEEPELASRAPECATHADLFATPALVPGVVIAIVLDAGGVYPIRHGSRRLCGALTSRGRSDSRLHSQRTVERLRNNVKAYLRGRARRQGRDGSCDE